MSVLLSARFHTTVAQSRQLPRGGLPEIAFAGRSNAGKSSAINALCQRRRLAFSSRTPGRTQALNFFAIGPADAPNAFLVDTPGYGYAAAPQSVRQAWDALAGRYLSQRASLRGVVLTVDCRRLITELDRRLIEWLSPDVPLLVLLTKSDKFGYAERLAATRKTVAQLAQLRPHADPSVIAFSVTQRLGLDEARGVIEGWLSRADDGTGVSPPQAAETPAGDESGV